MPLGVSAGVEQEYVEDCPVCCHPNVVRVTIDEAGLAIVRAHRE